MFFAEIMSQNYYFINFEVDAHGYKPKRVVADTEGNGEFDFWVIFEDFRTLLRIFGGFLENFLEIGSL